MGLVADQDRIRALEDRLARLEQSALRSGNVNAVLDASIPVRLARTVTPSGGSYPAASASPTCYPIIFLDGTYTRTAGAHAPTWTDRQTQSRDVAYSIVDSQQASYVPVGTIVAVFFKNDRWWFQWHSPNIFAITLGATLAGGATVSITLPDGRTETGLNQTTASLSAGRATAYRDSFDGNWYITGAGAGGVGGGSTPVHIEGYVYAAFTKTTPRFLAKVTHDDAGLLAPNLQVTVENFATPTRSTPYEFEGEFGAPCLFRRDELSGVYRVIWVECAVQSPVQVSPGDAPHTVDSFNSPTNPYSFGGL